MPTGRFPTSRTDALHELSGTEIKRLVIDECNLPDLPERTFPCGLCGMRCVANRGALRLLHKANAMIRNQYLRRLPCISQPSFACAGVKIALVSAAAGLPMLPRPCDDASQTEPKP